MDKVVSVHHVDKGAFQKGNIEHDPEEVVLECLQEDCGGISR